MNVKKIILLALTGLTMASCEKVIHPDLSNGKTLLVIQSRISTDSVPWEVKLTLTQDYFNPDTPPPVSGALVYISDNAGNTDTLLQGLGGNYFSRDYKKCVPGRYYTLTVKHGGKTYTAGELCHFQEPIDSLTFEYRKRQGFIPAGYYVTEHAKEKEGAGDYYLWEIYRNDTLITDFGYFTSDDNFVNGNYISASFPFPFNLNDSILVDQFAISKQWYNYLNSVQTEANKSGSPFDSPPANPISNIKGEAVGYFAVLNLQRAGIRIKE